MSAGNLNLSQLYSYNGGGRSMSANSLADTRGPKLIMPDEPMKPRIRPEGRQYYDKDKAGGIASAFQWNVAEETVLPLHTPERMRLKQKNFITLNKDEVQKIEDKVKEAQKKIREQILREELSKPLFKSDKKPEERPSSNHLTTPINDRVQMPKRSERQSRRAGKSTSNQMANGHAGQQQNGRLHNADEEEPLTPRSKSVDPSSLPQGTVAKKHANQNHRSKRAPSADRKKPITHDDALAKHPRGEVPKYIKERKKSWRIAKEPEKRPEAPAGHVLMNPEEKSRTLASLKRAEADLLKRYNSLPVRTDTDFLKRKKQVLMQKLEEVDEAIKIFSRPKVFIKTDPY